LSTTINLDKESCLPNFERRNYSRYKYTELALPYLNETEQHNKQLTEMKARRERSSDVTKEGRREPIHEYIKSIRGILLARISMINKKQEIKRMKEYIKKKELTLDNNKKIHEGDMKLIEKYVELIRNKALKKRKEVADKIKLRQSKENTLDELVRIKADLKKALDINKDECALYKSYIDFIKSLTSEANKENVEKFKRDKTFLTGQNNIISKTMPELIDEEIKELEREYGVKEDDSDTEIDPGFTVQEIFTLMEKQTTENLRLIQELQKKEEALERIKRNSNKIIEEKSKLLKRIHNDINDITEEAKKKQVLFNELAQRLEYDFPTTSNTFISEELMKEKQRVKQARRIIKQEIREIKTIFINSDVRHKELDYKANNDELELLAYITDALMRLKMVREWKFLSSENQNVTVKLLKRELEERNRQKQIAADKVKEENLALARRRKEKLQQSLKIARQRIYGKENMKRISQKEGPIKKKHKEVKKIDATFDDKYFIE